jgi:hypothetical protein
MLILLAGAFAAPSQQSKIKRGRYAMSRDVEKTRQGNVSRIVGSALIALVAIFIFGAMFRTGIYYGMDRKVAWEAYGRVLNAVGAILTELRYGEGGYAISDQVHWHLSQRGFTAEPDITKKLGITVPENFQATYLDDVIQRMWRDLASLPEIGRQSIRGLGADDVGYVDFARLAFWTFGLHVRSFYYMFFVIMGTSLLLALVERARDRVGQIIILGTASIIYATCYYSDILLLVEPTGSGNMMNPRFMPVIGLIPAVHILLMMVDGVRPQWHKVAIVLVQAGIVFFAVHVRATAVWLVVLLVLAMIVLALPLLREGWRRKEALRVLAGRFAAARWPALMAVLVVYGGLKVVSLLLHPIYHQGGWLQHHAMWHSIYYSLQYHPKFVEKYGAAHFDMAGDAMPVGAALAYVKEHPEEDKPEIYLIGKSLKYAEMERLSKLAFFQFLRRDPWFVLTAFNIKTVALFRIIGDETRLTWNSAPIWQRVALLCGFIFAGVLASRSSAGFQKLWMLAAAFSVGAVASMAIPILTVVVAQVISEQIMATQIMLLMWISVFAALLAVTARRYLDRYFRNDGLVAKNSAVT